MTQQTINHLTDSDSIGRAPSSQLKYVPAETGRSFRSPVDQITFLITGEQTGGAFFMAEVRVPPGGGPPPHIHRCEDEAFYLQQGTVTIQVGSKTLHATPGDFVYLPRGIMHCFKNTGKVEAKFLLVVTPAGLENFFKEAFYPAQDSSAAPPPITEAMLNRLLSAAANHGLEFAPPAGSSPTQVRSEHRPTTTMSLSAER